MTVFEDWEQLQPQLSLVHYMSWEFGKYFPDNVFFLEIF